MARENEGKAMMLGATREMLRTYFANGRKSAKPVAPAALQTLPLEDLLSGA